MYDLVKRFKHILSLAAPIIFGMLSINILDLVDTAMIGHLGDNALAATGFGSFVYWTCFSAIIGFTGALQTLTSRRLGENKVAACGIPLNAGLSTVFMYSLPVTLILYVAAPYIFTLFSTDIDVIQLSVDYFRFRIIGLFAIGGSLCFRAFWNGIKEPLQYTYILIATHCLNIFLNWLFIFGNWGFPELGVKGAGLGSTIASFLGLACYFFITWIKKKHLGVFTINVPKNVFKQLLYIGWPAAVDELLFAANILCLFWIFSLLGTAEAAVAHVVIVCVLIIWLPGKGFGLAALTLVSEALGKSNSSDAKRWAWHCIYIAAPILFAIGLISFPFTEQLLGIFIQNPDTLSLGIFPLHVDQLSVWTGCVGLIFVECLIGAGATSLIMKWKIVTRWIIFIPGAYILVTSCHTGLNGLWIYWALFNTCEMCLFLYFWQKGDWVSINV